MNENDFANGGIITARLPDKTFKFNVKINGQLMAVLNVKATTVDSAKFKAAQVLTLEPSPENNVPTFEL